MPISRTDLKGMGAEQSLAQRVVVRTGQDVLTFVSVNVLLDGDVGLAHFISRDGSEHLATAPIASIYIEWQDVKEIRAAP